MLDQRPRNAERFRPGRYLLSAGILACIAMAAPPVHACGYHAPQDMARGLLNWSYPKALYVNTAVWQAEDAGILPERPRRKAKNLFGYNAVVGQLRAIGETLSDDERAADEFGSFSIVLVDSVMWTRFNAMADGYEVVPHSKGPEKGTVVIVTHSKVISALAKNELLGTDAETFGLVRLYGAPGDVERARSLIAETFGNTNPPMPRPG